MNLANYIQDLLYRYDCVIVPEFGGFITNKIGAKFEGDTLHPPTKQLSFNSLLKHNDGLLANHIANAKNLSFEEANHYISVMVAKWNHELKSTTLEIEKIGSFSLDYKNQLLFEPSKESNYLLSSFGLTSVTTSTYIQSKEKVIPISSTTKKKYNPNKIAKYAAAAAIVLILGYSSYNGHQNNLLDKDYAIQKQALDNKIQSASFVIKNPLPTIELNVSRDIAKYYYIVAGAFQDQANAKKRVKELQKKGFINAQILGKNKWGLTQVAYESFYNRADAYKYLDLVRKTDVKDAWLLVNKFD